MLLNQKQINEMSKDELRELIKQISAERAKGFKKKRKKSRASDPFKDLPPDVLMKLIEELKERGAMK